MSGRYTILYGWRKWRTDLQFSMGGRGIGVPVKNSVKVDGIEELKGIELFVGGGGRGGRVYISVGVEGIVTGLQFCLGGWKFGRVYNSVRVEGMAGGYTVLLG
ncbi:hypothetical protein T03_8763 [Trichinella britovi]|uniref:Uncharacterized protein n=1 Tax=Trichinella britovi TaxID=45882 RepID=A0A0V1AJ18_TRIBR|nr:hypothetical protein T03_8763 [Trichinella britovi]